MHIYYKEVFMLTHLIRITLFLAVLNVGFATSLFAGPKTPGKGDAPQAAREAWKNDAFGIFMHWGPSTIFQGRYQDKEFNKDLWGEWFLRVAGVPRDEYDAAIKTWRPTKFNAKEWMDILQDSGAKYFVFVAKHHDGIALFKCDKTPYNAVDYMDYKVDFFGQLSDEARKHGIKPGFYYSHGTDWHELPNKAKRNPKLKEYDEYFQRIVYPHLNQLCGAYGKQNVVWFDLGSAPKQALECLNIVRKYNPNTMISSRIGGHMGDFSTGGDQSVPPNRQDGCWETCMTTNWHWAWTAQDRQFKTPADLIRMLARVRARGGNLLLNIGPDCTGEISFADQFILKKMGAWLKVNGDAIYAVRPSPYEDLPWGVCVVKPSKPGLMYAHILSPPCRDEIFLPGLKNNIKKAYFLAGGPSAVIPVKKVNEGWELNLSAGNPKAEWLSYADTVVAIEYEGELSVDTAPVLDQDHYPNVFLPCQADRKVINHSGGCTLRQYRFDGYNFDSGISQKIFIYDVANNLKPKTRFEWKFNIAAPNEYLVYVDYCNRSGETAKAIIEIAGQKVDIELPPTVAAADDMRWFVAKYAGHFKLKPAKDQTLALQMNGPVPNKLKEPKIIWNQMSLARRKTSYAKNVFMIRSVKVKSAYPPLLPVK